MISVAMVSLNGWFQEEKIEEEKEVEVVIFERTGIWDWLNRGGG